MTMAGEMENSQSRENADEPLFSLGEAPLDRMPAIGLIFENAARACQRSLGEHIDEVIAVNYEKLEARRISDFISSLDDTSSSYIFSSSELKTRAAVVAAAEFNHVFLEAILGSGVSEANTGGERPLTRLERRLLEFGVEKIFAGLASALASLVVVSFRPDPSAGDQGLASLGSRGSVLIMAYFRIAVRDGSYRFSIALPRAALDPFRLPLSRMPGLDGHADDARWSDDLYQQIARTEIRIDVRLEAHGFTLEDVSQLEVGDLLRLPIAPASPIRVETEGRTLFWCTLGQKEGYFTVRLEDFSDARQSFIENILGV